MGRGGGQAVGALLCASHAGMHTNEAGGDCKVASEMPWAMSLQRYVAIRPDWWDHGVM